MYSHKGKITLVTRYSREDTLCSDDRSSEVDSCLRLGAAFRGQPCCGGAEVTRLLSSLLGVLSQALRNLLTHTASLTDFMFTPPKCPFSLSGSHQLPPSQGVEQKAVAHGPPAIILAGRWSGLGLCQKIAGFSGERKRGEGANNSVLINNNF